MKQGQKETLRNFLDRYQGEVNQVYKFDERTASQGLVHAIRGNWATGLSFGCSSCKNSTLRQQFEGMIE